MTLYDEIAQIDDAINDYLDSDADIDINALDNLFQVKSDTIARGLESLCKIRARRQLTITAIDAEIARLKNRKKSESRALERLEQYIMTVFKRSGEKKVEAGTFAVSTRTSNVVWVDPNFNVPEFMRTTTTTAVDKGALRDALKNGRTYAGAYMISKEHLQIK